MSAIAIVLAEMGHTVSGSDIREQPVLDRLRAAGITVHVGHHRSYVEGCDAVTSSTAVPASNIELRRAIELGIPTLRRAGMLASICARARSVAVAGTHGKTTTTSMLMLALAEGGLAPSFLVGGDVSDAGTGAQWTGSDLLVVEADESDGTHLELPLYATMLTNIEADHLDHYGSLEAIVASFDEYLAHVDGPKVLCVDDPRCAELARRARRHDVRAGARRRLPRRLGASGVWVVSLRGRPPRCAARAARAPAARGPQRRQRRRGGGDGHRARGPFHCDRRGARSLRRGRPAIRRSRRRRRRDVRRRLRPPADGDRRRDRRGAGGAATAGNV